MQNETHALYDQAVGGDKEALQALLMTVRDMVFNLSLRMLGSPQDAEDATQEIYIRIITGLSSFRKDSAFSTWAYRIAANHLLNYKKSMFAQMPALTFEYYGADIENGAAQAQQNRMDVDADMLADELKLSCTNVMLQCFDPESRLVYVLGTMFHVDSKTAGKILGITPEAYRQRLSRLKQRMADFLRAYCGLGTSEKCSCKKRINYAIETKRLDPAQLVYSRLSQAEDGRLTEYKEAMEDMDAQSAVFAGLPKYRAPEAARAFLDDVLGSPSIETILREGAR